MQPLPTVLLRPGEADRVLSGHPWIYGGSILRLTQPVEDGGVVQVKDHRQRFLGVGFYNSRSKINVRLLDSDRVEIGRRYFSDRIRRALAVRERHMPGATSYRVVNAEGDLLSGLIVDKYEDVLVLQTSSLGMDQRKDLIVAALQEIFSPRAIIERNDMASRRFEGLPEREGILSGGCDARLTVKLNDLNFELEVLGGHKTGLYLDQQENYRRVGELAAHIPGCRALDAFTFGGGFALHLARAGASHVFGIDQSEEAVAAAQRNAAANQLADRCAFLAANVFDWLKQETSVAPHEKVVPRFDLIVLDPPSFTRTRSAVTDAMRGYKEIHLRALKLLRPGGIMATFCCSHHVNAEMFEEAILAAAYDTHRVLRRVASFQQAPDHPVLPSIPETEYLKGFAYEVARP